jgi:serine phosphatase RsbU (regulator of sigma subunit)
VPGAFVSMLVKAIERQITARLVHGDENVSPAKILSIFNKSMKHLLKQEDEYSISNAGFDGGVIYYNKKESIVKYAGAETALFYIDAEGQLQTIKGSRHSVGYKKSDINFEFKEHIIEVQEGMKFYLTTDGYLDQNGGEKGFPLGKKRFSEIILQYNNESFADQQEIFLDVLQEYQGNEDRNDDVTLIGFKI